MENVSFSDLLLMFTSWESIGDKYFVIHHFAALYAYYYVLVSCFLLVWCTMTSSRSPRSFCTYFYFCRVKGYCLTLLISACFQNSPPHSWTNGKYYLNIHLKAFNATVTWAYFLIALFLMNFSWFFHMLGYHKLSKPSLVNGCRHGICILLGEDRSHSRLLQPYVLGLWYRWLLPVTSRGGAVPGLFPVCLWMSWTSCGCAESSADVSKSFARPGWENRNWDGN